MQQKIKHSADFQKKDFQSLISRNPLLMKYLDR